MERTTSVEYTQTNLSEKAPTLAMLLSMAEA